ncbi:MAG TPA: helix-turn-helix transcriptional regulator [Acidimicrobiia bacterium]|nr:helix-turn-helix transcriptional regulator [Acidimicrobiia bacterium]
MSAGELVRSVRRRRGLTQAELARRAGTSQPVVSAYERGRRDPTLGTLQRLVEAGGERLRVGAEVVADGPAPAGSVDEHARRLVDVLLLAEAIPARPRPRVLRAPRLLSS